MNTPHKNKKHIEFAHSLCFAIFLFLFILSFSIALPIYIRPIYYAYSEASRLAEHTGYDKTEIKEAYDSVLDYLTIPERDFSVGNMKYSEYGKAHFEDCKKLFTLNTEILLLSATATAVVACLAKKRKRLTTLLKRGCLYAGICSLILSTTIGIFASLNFNFTFTLFHTLFFPGKSNWIFNPHTDSIITILPQEFFIVCGVVIGLSVFILSLLSIFLGNKKL